jgi:sulfoxide reductase heme-binding subunit YedZ
VSGSAPAGSRTVAAKRQRPPRKRVLAPWKDRQGRFSWMKTAVLVAAFLPGLVTIYWWSRGELGGRPVMEAIHETGLWGIRFLIITLAISPARAVFASPRLVLVRRMLGLTALAYLIAHFSLYVVSEHFSLPAVATEIVRRFYLTIGFVALLTLVALGVTSTDAMIRRMGQWWKRLHWLIYPVMVLALLHYFIQAKANVSESVVFAGFYLWLIGLRLLPAAWRAYPLALLGLSALAAFATAWVEFTWYALATGINPWRVLAVSETLKYGIRPAHIVGLAGLAVTAIAAVRWAAGRLADRTAQRAAAQRTA